MELSKTKQVMLETLSEKAMTARDLFYRLRGMGLPTGLAAVYTMLDELSAVGQVTRYEREDKLYFLRTPQAQESEVKLTLHCTCCGAESHLDAELLAQLLQTQAQFDMQSVQATVHGTCQACRAIMSA